MRIVMFGTGPFAVPTFESLLDSAHQVLALVTRPIADAGKRRKSAENPTRDVAEKRGVNIFDPINVNASDFIAMLKSFSADLFVVCDYGQILSNDCLDAARLGGINLHGSLLPRYRGAAPIHWAIYHGETQTGITIIHMTSRLDGGPILAQAAMPVEPSDTTAEIEPRLAELGVRPVHQAIERLANWDGVSPLGEKQDPRLATKAPRLTKSDGLIDWTRTAEQIVNQTRAFQPWPGTYTQWQADPSALAVRIIVHRATVAVELSSGLNANRFSAGQVVSVEGGRLLIQAGAGVVELLEIQPAGKRAMPVSDFLRGNSVQAGNYFG